jgi:predicted site-specific integrase-resolvase
MNKKGSPYTKEVEPHYSVTKSARLVGVCRQTMSEYVRDGRVHPVRRISKTVVRVPVSSINRFLCNA